MAEQAEVAQTQLWLGSPEQTHEQVCTYIAQHTDRDVADIRAGKQPFILWLQPEGVHYKRQELSSVFYRTSLRASDTERWFIVITAADRLTSSTANSLLKVLEEPPERYTFILCAQYYDWVLPTIRSRSVLYACGTDELADYPIVESCYQYRHTSYAQFAQRLRTVPNEYESRMALDMLISRWHNYHKSLTIASAEYNRVERIMRILIAYTDMLPVSGSAKYFWRDVFVALKMIN